MTMHLRNSSRVRKGVSNLLTRILHFCKSCTFHLPSQILPHYNISPTCINLPTCISNEHTSTENNSSSCTQSVQPMLGFTPAEVCRAESNPTLTIPQLLEIEPCREYTETPLKMLDSLNVTQPKKFLPLTQGARKLVEELHKEEIASQWAGLPPKNFCRSPS